MNLENLLVLLSVLLGLLGTQFRKLRRWLRKQDANLVLGNDTSRIEVTISNSNQDQRRDDLILQECPKPSSEETKSKKW